MKPPANTLVYAGSRPWRTGGAGIWQIVRTAVDRLADTGRSPVWAISLMAADLRTAELMLIDRRLRESAHMSATKPIRSDRLMLTPLDAADAGEMVAVLSDQDLYTFMGGEPPTLEQLQELYRRQSAGSPRADETWHNWVIRLDGRAIGYVQATVRGGDADLAWVVGSSSQGVGYGTEASKAMRDWLADRGVTRFSAHVHPDHAASQAVAAKLGLQPTGQVDDQGEVIWA